MKKKYLAAILAAAMLSGCSMPDVSFENANSSLFVKKEEKDAGGDLSGGDAVASGKSKDDSLANGGQPTDSASLSEQNGAEGKKGSSDGGDGANANDGNLSGSDESKRPKNASDGGNGADTKHGGLSEGDGSKPSGEDGRNAADGSDKGKNGASAFGKDNSDDSDADLDDSSGDDGKTSPGKTGSSGSASLKDNNGSSSSTGKSGSKKDQAAPDQFGVRLARSTDRSYDKSSGNTQASIDYTWVQLTDDAAAKHPKLKSVLDKTETDLRKQMAKEFENLKSKAKTSAGKSGRTWSIEQKELPVRADSDVFSTFTVVKEKQGTKSETSLVCSNFDSQTGKGIELADVIDTDDLPGLLAKAYAATYPDDPISGFEEMVDGYSDGDYVWAVSRDGLNFYFANEEDGSVLAVQVFREGNEDSFTGDYADAADSFAVPVGEGAYAFDKLDDGETDLLSVSLGEDESSVTVSMNGKRAVGRFHAYAIEPVLVRTEKEGYYIYVSCSLDNDYQQLAVFDISEDTPVFLGLVQNAGFPKEFDSDTQATMVTLPGNPDEFFLSESMDLLSTYDAARPYSVGDDGMPKALSEWLYPNREIELTVQNGFYADAVDAQTDELDEEGVKIAKGTELTIFRTDGKSAVDLKAKDGGIFRVDVDASGGWPQTIDGTDIQKLFDGIIFAG